MPITVHHYPNCNTCRNALKFLNAHGIAYTVIDIVQTPPSPADLRRMLAYLNGDLRKLFNTSGQHYRDLDLKSKLPTMSEAEAIDLLAQNGKLIKRPFLLADHTGLVGFKEDAYRAALL